MTNFSPDLPADSSRVKVLDGIERRVLGVLIEKAKTTPDAYPLSLNALRTGSNQKSNRFPQMNLDEDQVDRAADTLRQKKLVSLVQGDSRVERYRHLAYEWFGVDKVELAVLTELLLRGAQTVGELRGRAARMEPIKGINELTPVVASLVQKGHVVYLSPPGRGAIVSHTFYSPQEMERVRRDLGLGAIEDVSTSASSSPPPQDAGSSPSGSSPIGISPTVTGTTTSNPSAVSLTDWKAELTTLRAELTEQINDLREEFESFKQRVEG